MIPARRTEFKPYLKESDAREFLEIARNRGIVAVNIKEPIMKHASLIVLCLGTALHAAGPRLIVHDAKDSHG